MNKILKVEAYYTLELENVNNVIITNWLKLNKKAKLNIISFTRIPEELLQKYVRFLEEIENDMPTEVIEPYLHLSGNDLRQKEKELSDMDEEVISFIIIKEVQEIIGITRIYRKLNNYESMYQWQFGIRSDFRGTGIAKYLIAHSYKELIKSYNSLQRIKVDTHPSNKKMIKLLEAIGFQYSHTEKFRIDA